MRPALTTAAGRLLYRQLPEEHRHRDNRDGEEPGDLEAYLHGFGRVLDLVRGTLEQLHADAFADGADGRAIQTWMLPYLAELVGVELASPDPAARARELSGSVGWLRGKGTLTTAAAMADVVPALETVVVEGWRRTLVTPDIGGAPFTLAAAAMGDGDPLGPPAGPLGTPDLSRCDRAVLSADASDPVRSYRRPVRDADGRLPDERETARLYWRPRARGGAPCFPGAFDDESARTPDLSGAGPHPRRVAVHVAPPDGLFEPGLKRLSLTRAALEAVQPSGLEGADQARWIGPVDVYAALGLAGPAPDKLEIVLRPGRGVSAFRVQDGAEARYRDLLFLSRIEVEGGGRLALEQCAAAHVTVQTPPDEAGEPPLQARSSLIGRIFAPQALVRLEYVTVLGEVAVAALQASDCLFAGELTAELCEAERTCIRYSRIPAGFETAACGPLQAPHNAAAAPRFVERALPGPDGVCTTRVPVFGEPGCGVLDHRCPAAVRHGAEDGGEQGAYHDRHFAAGLAALARKLGGFLPLGQEAAIFYDPRLALTPPTLT